MNKSRHSDIKRLLLKGVRTNPRIAKISEIAKYDPYALTTENKQYVMKWLKKNQEQENQ